MISAAIVENPGAAVALIMPILVAVVISVVGYRQGLAVVRMQTAATERMEARKADLAEWQAMVTELRAERDDLRAERDDLAARLEDDPPDVRP